MKKTLGFSAAGLAAVGIVAKLIGALYRIPLTNIIGAEGMGLYQTVFPVYTILLAFCGGSMTGAVSRTVAKYMARGEEVACPRIVIAAAVPMLTVSVAVTCPVMLAGGHIARLQGNPDAGVCYLALTPSLLFAGGISAFRGYFLGKNNILPSGVSQLIEQTVKLVLGLAFSRMLLPRGVKYAVFGALIGVTAGEALCMLYLAVRYLISSRRAKKREKQASAVSVKQLIRELFSFAFPVMLGSLILPATHMLDTVFVVNILVKNGADVQEATALFGICGTVATLVNMPGVIAASVCAAVLPALTSDIERGGDGRRLTEKACGWIMLVTVPVAVVFFIFPSRIVTALFGTGLDGAQIHAAATMLRLQAVSVMYTGVMQLFTAVLQARGRARRPLVGLASGAAVKALLTPILVGYIGVYGVAFCDAALYGIAAAFTARAAYGVCPMCIKAGRAVLLPLIASAVSGAVFCLVLFALEPFGLPYFWETAISGAAFIAAYAAAVAAYMRAGRVRAPGKRDPGYI